MRRRHPARIVLIVFVGLLAAGWRLPHAWAWSSVQVFVNPPVICAGNDGMIDVVVKDGDGNPSAHIKFALSMVHEAGPRVDMQGVETNDAGIAWVTYETSDFGFLAGLVDVTARTGAGVGSSVFQILRGVKISEIETEQFLGITDPPVLDPSGNPFPPDTATFTYEICEDLVPQRVTLRLSPGNIAIDLPVAVGRQQFVWDGKVNDVYVPPGNYTARIDVLLEAVSLLSNTIDFTIFDIELPVLEVERAKRETITASVVPSVPDNPTFVWTFLGGKGGTTVTSINEVGLVLVDGTPDKYAVIVQLQKASAFAYARAGITVKPRTGAEWMLTPTLAEDNEPNPVKMPDLRSNDVGKLPTCSLPGSKWVTDALLGQERDRESNLTVYITPSDHVPNQQYEDGYGRVQVNDSGGPNDGYWYIEHAQPMKIDRESVINPWIKPGAASPAPGQPNWFTQNGAAPGCADPGVFLQAIKNHEARGGIDGHFSLLEKAEAQPGNDPRTAVEDKFSTSSETSLINKTNQELSRIDSRLSKAAGPEKLLLGANWPGDPDISLWNPTTSSYSPCTCFDRPF